MIIVIMIAIVEDMTRSKGTASNINNSKTTATTMVVVVDMPHLLRTAFPARNISNEMAGRGLRALEWGSKAKRAGRV
jgi:hypothetical protein